MATKKTTEKTKPVAKKATAARKTAPKKLPLTEKELATQNGQPYVNILSIELDPDNVGQGAFELDWNEFFVTQLIRSGYAGRDDQQIVDRWFQDICRNVALETWEQYDANSPRGIVRKDLGNGKTEVS